MTARIVLIHAVAVAIEPVASAFARLWPDAETVNLLDDSLSADRAAAGHLDRRMMDRFGQLGDYAVAIGADGVLFTCSAFGPAIEAVARQAPVPVLKPNHAMFEQALDAGRRVGMLVTFAASVASMSAEFAAMAEDRGIDATLEPCLVEEAMAALRHGDRDRHDRLLVEAAGGLSNCDAVVLAQFSMAAAQPAVAAALDMPVLTAPDSAVVQLRSVVTGA